MKTSTSRVSCRPWPLAQCYLCVTLPRVTAQSILKLGTSGVLYNGQFSGTLLFCGVPFIARHGRREGYKPVFGQVEQLQMRLLILPFV